MEKASEMSDFGDPEFFICYLNVASVLEAQRASWGDEDRDRANRTMVAGSKSGALRHLADFV